MAAQHRTRARPTSQGARQHARTPPTPDQARHLRKRQADRGKTLRSTAKSRPEPLDKLPLRWFPRKRARRTRAQASAISYSSVPNSRPTRSAPRFRSSPVMAALSAATAAVNRRMPSWQARSDNRASSSVPRPRPCQPHDGDGDLGGVRVLAVPDVPGDAHAAPAGVVKRTERLVVAVVDVGEVAQLGR